VLDRASVSTRNPEDRTMKDRLFRSGVILFLAAAFVGCQPEGPAERAGKSVDKAAEGVKDAISPPGPLEKAGREVDKAIDR
jgi:hypothetical protein